MAKTTELEKLNTEEFNYFTRTRFFNRGYEGIITLGAYFKLFELGIIDPSPLYQRPYHYNDDNPEKFGEPWQLELIGDLISGEKIPMITFRETTNSMDIQIFDRMNLIKMFIQELLDGGHRSRTFYSFYKNKLKTPSDLFVTVNGKIYDVGGMFWDGLPVEVREHTLNDLKLNIDVYQNFTDTEAGMKFEKLNNLHDMTAQEKRQWHKVQISESVRDLSAIDKTKFKMFDRDGMKFKYVGIPVTGRVTDEITAKLAYAIQENVVKNNAHDDDNPNNFPSLGPNKAKLDSIYNNGDKLHEKAGDYHSSNKTMTRVKDVLNLVSDVIYDNRTDDNMSYKLWTKSGILKTGLLFNEWMDEFGVESVKNMDTKLLWQKLSVLLRSDIKEHQFRAYTRYKTIDGKVIPEYKKPLKKNGKEVLCGFGKEWTNGERIDDFEWVKQTIEADWNPAEWGIFKLDKRRNFSDKQKQEIFDRDNHTCVECGATENLETDHIKPWEKGGQTIVENGQTLCRTCNASKSNKISDDTLSKLSIRELGDLFRNGKITLEQQLAHSNKSVA